MQTTNLTVGRDLGKGSGDSRHMGRILIEYRRRSMRGPGANLVLWEHRGRGHYGNLRADRSQALRWGASGHVSWVVGHGRWFSAAAETQSMQGLESQASARALQVPSMSMTCTALFVTGRLKCDWKSIDLSL